MTQNNETFSLLRWIKKHPMQTVYIFLGVTTLGAALGYFFPDLARWIVEHDLIDSLGRIVGILIGIGIAIAILLTAFGG